MKLIVGISGSSGTIYGVRLVQVLHEFPEVETHLIVSPAARQSIALETDWRARDVERLADVTYRHTDIAAAISSGSYPIDAMAVVPCSMRSVAAMAWSLADNLLLRAADVTLKERRPLVVAVRESPLHVGHLRSMAQLAEMGAVIAPLMPSFYSRPKSIEDLIDHVVGRLMDLLGITPPDGLVHRWQGPRGALEEEPAATEGSLARGGDAD